MRANCPMDLRLFPFDKQQCNLNIESCKLFKMAFMKSLLKVRASVIITRICGDRLSFCFLFVSTFQMATTLKICSIDGKIEPTKAWQ